MKKIMINKKVVAMKIVFLDIYAHAACSSMLSDGTAVRHDTTVTDRDSLMLCAADVRLSGATTGQWCQTSNSFWCTIFYYVKMMMMMIIKYAILGSIHLLCRREVRVVLQAG